MKGKAIMDAISFILVLGGTFLLASIFLLFVDGLKEANSGVREEEMQEDIPAIIIRSDVDGDRVNVTVSHVENGQTETIISSKTISFNAWFHLTGSLQRGRIPGLLRIDMRGAEEVVEYFMERNND